MIGGSSGDRVLRRIARRKLFLVYFKVMITFWGYMRLKTEQ